MNHVSEVLKVSTSKRLAHKLPFQQYEFLQEAGRRNRTAEQISSQVYAPASGSDQISHRCGERCAAP